MQPEPVHPKRFRNITLGAVLLCVLAVSLYRVFAPGHAPAVRPVSAADLKGVWTTAHPQYQDRFLQFDDEVITFGWGAGRMGSYTIAGLDTEPGRDGTLIRVHYRDLESTGYQVKFWYADQNGGVLRMHSQGEIRWLHTHDTPIYPHRLQ